MLLVAQTRVSATTLIALALLQAACAKAPDPQAVAEQFVRAYFVEDNMAGAVKLSSGSAKTQLEGRLRQIEAAGAKEPPKERPRVSVALLETQPGSGDAIGYIYRVQSEVPGIEPITAKLALGKVGNAWLVSDFVQTP